MKESIFSKMVREGLHDQQAHVTQIETASVSEGVPDLHCMWAGLGFWIELKTQGSEIRPAQKAWMIRQSQCGGRVWILDGYTREIHIWAVFPAIVRELYPYELTGCHVAKAPYNWYNIRQYLTASP